MTGDAELISRIEAILRSHIRWEWETRGAGGFIVGFREAAQALADALAAANKRIGELEAKVARLNKRLTERHLIQLVGSEEPKP
jgi:hypothetical protein